MEHSCKIISNSIHWLRRRKRLKIFSIFTSDGHLVQRSGTVCAIMVDGQPRKIPLKLFQNPSSRFGEVVESKGCRRTGDRLRPVTIAHHEHFVLR